MKSAFGTCMEWSLHSVLRWILTQATTVDHSTVSTSVSFKRTPENILKLAFQDGCCIFSLNNPLNRL